jgi:DNA polymerase (family 10)
MKNYQIAKIFNNIANILEIEEENPFRIRAYRRAAQNIEGLTDDVAEVAKLGKLEEIPGIGKDLAQKIQEIVTSGKLKFFENLQKKVPQVVLNMLEVSGIGPKTSKMLHDKLKIKSIEHLEKLALAHKLVGLPGLKGKIEENILRGIEIYKKGKERLPLGRALPLAEDLIFYLKESAPIVKISAAGSVRRMKETVKDVDILVASKKPEEVMSVFIRSPLTKNIISHGKTRSSILTTEDIQVDVRVVEPESFGAALCYFTGSKAHNIRLREMAVRKGLKINEYGIYLEKDDRKIGGQNEEDIYEILKLPFIPPEIREDQGEIECGLNKSLPRLVELLDIKGDLHLHTTLSDGGNSIEEMAEAARKLGYEYICITEHSKSLGVARGLSEADLLKLIDRINKLNNKFKKFKVLAGAEIDIKTDGSLDYSDKTLSKLDLIVASIHTGFKRTRFELTKRMIKAMESGFVDIIAHPSGRLIGEREGYELDYEEIFKVAKKTNTTLEINAHPSRLDLTDINCRRAKEHGVKVAISTDAHAVNQMNFMHYGLSVARRGWLEKNNILNCLPLKELKNR